jgi:hypothetical protein
MPRLLDPALVRVASHRQVSIKTARDWRDSDNRKWHDALAEIGYLPPIEVPAVPVRGFFDKADPSPAHTATTADKATSPNPDPFNGLELVDPFEGQDPFAGFSLDEVKL